MVDKLPLSFVKENTRKFLKKKIFLSAKRMSVPCGCVVEYTHKWIINQYTSQTMISTRFIAGKMTAVINKKYI